MLTIKTMPIVEAPEDSYVNTLTLLVEKDGNLKRVTAQDMVTDIVTILDIPTALLNSIYIPSVSIDGIISWTNKSSLPVPEPINIKGPMGPAGEQGPRGYKGDTGPQGEKGSKGDTGQEGPVGPKGEKGDSGPVGPKGEKGDSGPVGPKGEKGDSGDQGVRGPDGDKGDPGPVGPKGEKGDPGVQGSKGDTGPAGDKGDKGEKGDKGDKGDPGPAGLDGKSSTSKSRQKYKGVRLSLTNASSLDESKEFIKKAESSNCNCCAIHIESDCFNDDNSVKATTTTLLIELAKFITEEAIDIKISILQLTNDALTTETFTAAIGSIYTILKPVGLKFIDLETRTNVTFSHITNYDKITEKANSIYSLNLNTIIHMDKEYSGFFQDINATALCLNLKNTYLNAKSVPIGDYVQSFQAESGVDELSIYYPTTEIFAITNFDNEDELIAFLSHIQHNTAICGIIINNIPTTFSLSQYFSDTGGEL